MTARHSPPIVLVIAGSDSGGGAGIQADLRTLAAHHVHGVCVVTAITAQNTRAVTAIEPISPRIVAAQLEAVLTDFRIDAVKIGVLAMPGIVRVVADALRRRPKLKVVLDPVLVATTGAKLARAGLVAALRKHLLPLADLLTPNIPEAEALLGRKLARREDMALAAEELIAQGAEAVLLKGGHMPGRRVADWLAVSDGVSRGFEHARLGVRGHGTGCTLSSAIAARLATGESIETAVDGSIAYVHRALARAYRPGRGSLAVLDHIAARRR